LLATVRVFALPSREQRPVGASCAILWYYGKIKIYHQVIAKNRPGNFQIFIMDKLQFPL